MAILVLVALVVLVAVALWVGRRRPDPILPDGDRPFVYQPRGVDTPEPARRPPPPQMSAPVLALPERDDGGSEGVGLFSRQIVIQIPAWIHYRDREGQESRRDILVKRLTEYHGQSDTIFAFCEARQANRTFHVSRILEFVDRRTGEFVSQVSEHLRQVYGETPEGRVELALSARLAEANVLAFIARADGSMRQKQRDTIAAYILAAEPSLAGCEAELSAAIAGLGPVQADYRRHVRDAKAKPELDQAALLAAAEAVAATRTTKREFTDSALQVVRKALGPPPPPKPKRTIA